MQECLCVGLGGFVGSVARYLLGLLPFALESGFPLKTFGINVFGSLLIGIVAALATKNPALDARLVLFLKAGFCGGFTTFSTFALEIGDLIERGFLATALLYAAFSAALGVAAFYAGQTIAAG